MEAWPPDCTLASSEWPGLSCCWLATARALGPSMEVITPSAALAKPDTTRVDPTCGPGLLRGSAHRAEMHSLPAGS